MTLKNRKLILTILVLILILFFWPEQFGLLIVISFVAVVILILSGRNKKSELN